MKKTCRKRREYLRFISESLEVEIGMISTGP